MAPHRPLEGRVVIATHNPGKLIEMRGLLAPFGVDAVSAAERGLAVPDETGQMFSENAALKAHAAAKATGLAAVADDSGLCVEALFGAPGIFTADWAGEPRDWMRAMTRVEDELKRRDATTAERRRARFVSALVVAWPDGHEELCEGTVEGTLTWPPRGAEGFGYDPMFVPDGQPGAPRTFAEMSGEEKHGIDWAKGVALSHRARAFMALAKACLMRGKTLRSAASHVTPRA